MNKLNTKEVIERCEKKHNYFYDYSLVEYVDHDTKIKIICPIHGIFEQRAYNHFSGYKCKKCSFLTEKSKQKKEDTFNDFIKKSKNKWGDKYDYSLVEYVNMNTKIKIICPIHGIFEQSPWAHMKCECLKCSIISNRIKLTKTIDVFVEQAKGIHGDKYCYDNVVYIHDKVYVDIICPTHGVFKQRPSNHLQGQSCPACKNTSRGEHIISEYLNTKKIIYEREKTFDECVSIIKLRFDFYLPELNICIEYDGAHHFIPVAYFSKDKDPCEYLEEIQNRDSLKNKYCIENGIKLIRINYKVKFKDIHNVLTKELDII